MNNPMGTTNSFLGGDNILLIFVLLMVLAPGMMGGCGNDSFMLILLLLVFMPSLNRGMC